MICLSALREMRYAAFDLPLLRNKPIVTIIIYIHNTRTALLEALEISER